MTNTLNLGRLERLDPHIAWPHEAHDFTPWLFANGDVLAEALGIDIQLDGMEHAIGGYRLDAEVNCALFDQLNARRDKLEEVYGEPLEFDPLEGKQACRVAAYRDGPISESGRHDEFVQWFVDSSERLRRALTAVEPDSAG